MLFRAGGPVSPRLTVVAEVEKVSGGLASCPPGPLLMRLDPVSTAAFAATCLTEPTQHEECAFTDPLGQRLVGQSPRANEAQHLFL